MNYQRLLAVYHYCTLYHGGQFSREYRLLCKVQRLFRPSQSEEYPETLLSEGNEEAFDIFTRLGGSLGDA